MKIFLGFKVLHIKAQIIITNLLSLNFFYINRFVTKPSNV